MSSIKHKISPCLWIEKDARKAVEFYQSIFKDTALVSYKEYKNTGSPSGDFDIAEMDLMGIRFQILAAGPLFKFNEAISFTIYCKDQDEVDYYWHALITEGGSEGPCGWCKDKYGLSWQVIPERLYQLEYHEDKGKQEYAFQAMMKMTKIIIADLEA
jgi:predicted 3-demethylubiquinone-9 3-methyltransferase (glyoxalase superfamily)